MIPLSEAGRPSVFLARMPCPFASFLPPFLSYNDENKMGEECNSAMESGAGDYLIRSLPVHRLQEVLAAV